jgi:uncharacterized membrane protein
MLKKSAITVILIFSFFISNNFTVYSQYSNSDERITSYHTTVKFENNHDININESINVIANQNIIKRGIYRDIPVKSKFMKIFNINHDLIINSITKDNKNETYFIENLGNTKRIYIGNKDIFLNPGAYLYSLDYSLSNFIRYNNQDKVSELYLNLLSTDWEFPVDQYSAKIFFPREINVSSLEIYGYSGYQGNKYDESNNDFDYEINTRDNSIQIQSTRVFEKGEGITFSFAWKNSQLTDNSTSIDISQFIFSNIITISSIIFVILILLFYLFTWLLFGRDPGKSTIYPIYSPPDSLLPAEIRYLTYMRYDSNAFLASIINLGVQGFLKIGGIKQTPILNKVENADSKLHKIEDTLYNTIFNDISYNFLQKNADSNPIDQLVIAPTNRHIISYAEAKLNEELQNKWLNKAFYNNTKFLLIGVFMHIGFILYFIIWSILNGFSLEDGSDLFMLMFATFWNGIVSVFVFFAFATWVQFIMDRKLTSLGSALFLSAFLTPFVFVGTFTLYMAASAWGIFLPLAILLPIFMHFIFSHAIKVRTHAGRILQDKIDGFKMFLLTSEAERIKLMNKEIPNDISTYEKYLPYAIALDVETEWTQSFANQLENLKNTSSSSTSMSWATGSFAGASSVTMVSSISSSLQSSISSSGRSGGGSSGGGSGGGGGGW